MRRHSANHPASIMTGSYSFIRYFLVALFVLPLWTGTAIADARATKSAAVAEPAARFTKGLLWKIETPGGAASHLFGTIHSDDPRITAIPDAVTRTLDASSRFVMEAVMDGESLVRMAEVMYYSDGRTLEQVVGRKLYAESVKALNARGLPTLGIEKQKPWAVMMALSMPPPRTGEFLDLVLQQRAAGQNKPVSGLETIAEQLAVFDGMPLRDQIALLEDTVRQQPELDREFETLHKAWLARDLAGIVAVSEKQKPGNERLYAEVMDRLLDQRNRRMAERMAPLLKQGDAFIAVGAAHLPGEAGLLYRLEQAGYRVTAVY
ncbi:MAG: TraB/GumN family protein [Pseudomonadota bacterium]